MKLNRRRFLSQAAKFGGPALAMGGLLAVPLARQAYARASLRRELVSAAVPLLADKASEELEELPASACKEIREYFHGLCLNVHGFAEEVCLKRFAENVASCPTEEGKHRLIDLAFSHKVATPSEVLNRVETIAKETGGHLDHNWLTCCSNVAWAWQAPLRKTKPAQQAIDLAAAMEPFICVQLAKVREAAYPAGERPALSSVLMGIGRSAILLLPVAAGDPRIAFPLFMIRALGHLWRWLVVQLSDQTKEFQTEISGRLTLLGDRLGSEFEQEIRSRVSDLHYWQELALEDAARQEASSAIPLLI
jgi:hypothetical protein